HPSGARLCIADRGPGVPEQERERIFAPFYRPTGMRERGDGGVGLGLALVRQIARHHGGDVQCVPRHGGGNGFRGTLQPAPGGGKSDWSSTGSAAHGYGPPPYWRGIISRT